MFIFMIWILVLLMLVPGSMAQDPPTTVIVILVVDDFNDYRNAEEDNFSEYGIEQVQEYAAGAPPEESCYLNPTLIEGQAMENRKGRG